MRTQAVRRACDHGCRTMVVQPAVSNDRFEFSDKDEAALGGLLKTKASHWSRQWLRRTMADLRIKCFWSAASRAPF
jgi:hypothetical protein